MEKTINDVRQSMHTLDALKKFGTLTFRCTCYLGDETMCLLRQANIGDVYEIANLGIFVLCANKFMERYSSRPETRWIIFTDAVDYLNKN